MLFAGHETTTGLLGKCLPEAARRRRFLADICRDPTLIPGAIEEVLCLDSSVITWRRRTTRQVDMGGVAMPQDAKLLLLLGAANRDPSVFPDPDRLTLSGRMRGSISPSVLDRIFAWARPLHVCRERWCWRKCPLGCLICGSCPV
jgi:cytochrome P450